MFSHGWKNVSDEDKEDTNASDNKESEQGAPEYKHLITIHCGKSKGPMKDCLKVEDKVKRLSLSEKKLKSAFESHGVDLNRCVSNLYSMFGSRFSPT